jgi:sirohydrochlorin cobaltochelatase
MTGYIVFGHGSSLASANASVRNVANAAAERSGWREYEVAFLEGIDTKLPEAVDALSKRGVSRIVIVPYFLTFGKHLERDLPALIDEIRATRPQLSFDVKRPLDGHPAMIEALVDRAKDHA